MPLDTSSKRRSSVGMLLASILAPPSPTDSPGVVDQDDRQHAGGSYAGIDAAPPIIPPEPPLPTLCRRASLMAGLLRTPIVDRVTLCLTPPWQRYFSRPTTPPATLAGLARTPFVSRDTLTLTPAWSQYLQEEETHGLTPAGP